MADLDTIAAISSAVGEAGIGIVRCSGKDAISIVNSIFSGKDLREVESHTIHYGHIVVDDTILDEVMVIVMKAPKTYTKEDIVEIDCHGGIFVLQNIVNALFSHGARPAEPGEFTKRAFLNGRLDLSQAESVMDIISSENEASLKNSLRQLNGKLSSEISSIREKILHETAFIESALDDPEHYSLDNYPEELDDVIQKLSLKIQKLLDSSEDGMLIRNGIRTAIVGKPNAGKSSLLNALAKKDRAIVTSVAGTTRDTLEEKIRLRDMTLTMIDTAGIHSTKDIVESMGVRKAWESMDEADLILYVVDSSIPMDENDEMIMDTIQSHRGIVLLNKTDLPSVVNIEEIQKKLSFPVISISAKMEEGMDALGDCIENMFFQGKLSSNDDLFITNSRHKFSLQKAYDSLQLVQESIHMGMPEDFFTVDLMEAYRQLGNILGESVEEDLVNEIFSKFCMGK